MSRPPRLLRATGYTRDTGAEFRTRCPVPVPMGPMARRVIGTWHVFRADTRSRLPARAAGTIRAAQPHGHPRDSPTGLECEWCRLPRRKLPARVRRPGAPREFVATGFRGFVQEIRQSCGDFCGVLPRPYGVRWSRGAPPPYAAAPSLDTRPMPAWHTLALGDQLAVQDARTSVARVGEVACGELLRGGWGEDGEGVAGSADEPQVLESVEPALHWPDAPDVVEGSGVGDDAVEVL